MDPVAGRLRRIVRDCAIRESGRNREHGNGSSSRHAHLARVPLRTQGVPLVGSVGYSEPAPHLVS